MNFPLVAHILALLLIVLAITMVPSLIMGFAYGEDDAWPFVMAVGVTLVAGFLTRWIAVRFEAEGKQRDIGSREGFAVVTLGWLLVAAFGCLPFLFHDTFGSGYRDHWQFGAFNNALADAFFETMSGFTTTGSSVLADFDQPHGIMFWRSLTHWLGGMGIILLSIAILPFLGVGGMQLFRAEVPGVVKDRITPRIADTAKTLWIVYIVLTVVQTLLLWLHPDMDLFNALCHTFGTVATGGFSTQPGSIGDYDSPYIHGVIIVFMVLAGTSFALHYRLFFMGDVKGYWQDEEFRVYLTAIGALTIIIMIALLWSPLDVLWPEALLASLFQVVSLLTTTGYATENYELWPIMTQIILFLLMFVGGCAGSTGGSMKVVRSILAVKAGWREIRRLLHPRAVVHVKLGPRSVPEHVLASVVGFAVLYMTCFVLGVIVMAALGLEFETAVSSVAANIGNIGPGLGSVGPAENYAHIPVPGKWVLSFLMLLGRLEIYTVLIILVPHFWRK